MSMLKEKAFMISVNLCDLTWDRKASTLPDSCRVRISVAIPSHYDTVPTSILHKAICKDVQRRYNVYPKTYNMFGLEIKLVQ